MKKLAILLLVTLLTGVVFQRDSSSTAVAQGETYRPPIVGTWEIKRTDCVGHSGTPGARFMDLNIDTSNGSGLTVNASLGGKLDYGFPIYSSNSGTVTRSSPDTTGFGWLIEVTGSQVIFGYAHVVKSFVTQGQQVSKGQLIAFVGAEGSPGNYHLHWEARPTSGNTFDLYSYFMAQGQVVLDNGVHTSKGAACVNSDGDDNDGYVVGGSLSGYSNCPGYYNQHFADVALFDASDCIGNLYTVTNTSQIVYLDQVGFNDRTRSIYIPLGKSVLMGPDTNDLTTHNYCWNIDMWNTDLDYYFNSSHVQSTLNIGWDADHTNGANMISWVQVFNNNNCSGSGNNFSGGVVLGSFYVSGTGGDGNGIYGNSAVDIRENPSCESTQYGWNEATNGYFNVPDYMDNKTTCIDVDLGFSVMVYEQANGLGDRRCFSHTVRDLSTVVFNSGVNANDAITSVQVFTNGDCNGQMSYGVDDPDTVTFWENTEYGGQPFGLHLAGSYSLSSSGANFFSSVGITDGWSVLIYEGLDMTGTQACLNSSDPYFQGDVFSDAATLVDENIESFVVFHDSNCGGWTPVVATATPMQTATPTLTVTPMPTATNTASTVLASGTGLTAEYYNNYDFTNLVFVRVDPMVNIDTGGAPDPNVGADTFSVRWYGFVEPRFSEEYYICTKSDDGIRVWFNATLVIDNWADHGMEEDCSVAIPVVAGARYPIYIEFRENGGASIAKLYWTSANQWWEKIPQAYLYPSQGSQPAATSTPLPTNTGVPTQIPTLTQTSQGPSVVNLVLVNANNSQDIATLYNGYTIDYALIGTSNISIRADASSNTESVMFGLDGVSNYHGENSVPYALNGDTNGTVYTGWTPNLGSHTVSVTPYSLNDNAGVSGVTVTMTFNVVNSATSTLSPSATPTLLPATATETGTSTLVPSATSTWTLTPTVPASPTNVGLPNQLVLLVSPPWILSAPSDGAEVYVDLNGNELDGRDTVLVEIDLNGLCALGGDASAFVFNQSDGWHYVPLTNYVQNCFDGRQTVEIPISDFNLIAGEGVSGVRSRFWFNSAYTVEIWQIVVFDSPNR